MVLVIILAANSLKMSEMDVKEQVRAIQKATNDASKTKSAALKFLKDAGIIDTPAPTKSQPKKK